jgi:hypothetical protein
MAMNGKPSRRMGTNIPRIDRITESTAAMRNPSCGRFNKHGKPAK